MASILVVDDDPSVLVVIQAALRGAGHSVLTFDDPEEAMEEVRGQQLDAAVLDVMMPGKTGYDLLGHLRSDPSTRFLPVLFLSALDSAPERIRGLREGADDYLGKPFDPEELLLRVQRLVERAAKGPGETLASSAPSRVAQVPGEMPPDSTGKFLGRYEIVELLGEGSMGTVYRGWDPKLQRTVALKTVKLDLARTTLSRSDLISRLVNEAVMGARFSHPNIVAVFDVGDVPPDAFIAMEFIEGPSLEVLLASRDRLEQNQVVHLAVQAARALAAAHAVDLVHHDVKPGNVIIGPDGVVKVTDFGLANWISEMVQDTGRVFGTPGFLAPEALRGEGYTTASDLFGLGAVMYRCLTGAPAFQGRTIAGIVANTLGGQAVPPRNLLPEIDPALEELVLDLLKKNPEDRPKDALTVVARLEELMTGPPPPWELEAAASGEEPAVSDLVHSRVLNVAGPI